jgi:hypothetical protein
MCWAKPPVLQHQIALSQDWTSIDKKPMQTAKRLHAKALERATEVFEGTITPPECTLWETSLAKLAEERKETLLLKAKLGVNNRAIANGNGNGSGGGGGGLTTKNISPADARRNRKHSSAGGDLIDRASKQRKTHNDPENLGEDGLDGYIVCPQTMGYFALPEELDAKMGTGGLSLCKKFYRKGVRCMFGKKCNRSHKHPKDLPEDKRRAFWTWVQGNSDGIKANDVLVNAAMLNL